MNATQLTMATAADPNKQIEQNSSKITEPFVQSFHR